MVKAAITAIPAQEWETVEYTDAVYDVQSQRCVSRAEVAEIDFTALVAQRHADRVPGRLVVRQIARRIADLNATPGSRHVVRHLADSRLRHQRRHRCRHAFTADKTHRGHAVIEQVRADLRASALAHPALGKFAAAISGPALARATTATIRCKLFAVPSGRGSNGGAH
jgi:hypothetical protein